MTGTDQEKSANETETEPLKDNSPNDSFPQSNCEYVKNKMETLQKRIDELKEKVKSEGELLHDETTLKTDISIEDFQDSLNTFNSFENHSSENESGSDKSLYFSPSSYSLCSLSTSSSADIAYNNFTKFVNKFVKNQNPKERLSLLQLHSKKQISLNMMRHSLTELDTRCSEEMELIERNIQHLQKLAVEFDVDVPGGDDNGDGKLKALEFHKGGSKKITFRSNPVFIWPHEERKSRVKAVCNELLNNDIAKIDKSSLRE